MAPRPAQKKRAQGHATQSVAAPNRSREMIPAAGCSHCARAAGIGQLGGRHGRTVTYNICGDEPPRRASDQPGRRPAAMMRTLRILARIAFLGLVLGAVGVAAFAAITLVYFGRELPSHS